VLIGSAGDTPETARFVPPPPEHVQPAVENLLQFLSDQSFFPPVIAAGITHYQFETIHPFEDGSGRLGRLLIALQLMRSGSVSHPLIYLSSYFEPRRDEYLRLLKAVSTHGAWIDWLMFFLNAVQAQADDARTRVERILGLHSEYKSKASTAGRSRVPAVVVDLVMENLFLTVGEVASKINCDYNTAKSALETLTRLGIVEPVEDTYPQRWWTQDLVRKVYEV